MLSATSTRRLSWSTKQPLFEKLPTDGTTVGAGFTVVMVMGIDVGGIVGGFVVVMGGALYDLFS